MSTVLIVVIIVVVVMIVAGLLLLARLPKARERARVQKRERELDERREQVVDEHRQEGADRERQAEIAEHRARVAAKDAKRERAESELAEEKARLHERGLADHELIDDDERQDFAGTSAVEPPGGPESTAGEAAHDPEWGEDFETGLRREQRPTGASDGLGSADRPGTRASRSRPR